MTKVEFNEAEALRYPLFQDDFGAPGDKVLRDTIITARASHTCCECWSAINPGDRYRKHVGKYDGSVKQYGFCSQCCAAMAKVFNGEPEAMDSRSQVRAANNFGVSA